MQDVNAFFSNLEPVTAMKFDEEPAAWAEALLALVLSRSVTLGVNEFFVPEIGRKVLQANLTDAAARRKAGNIEDATGLPTG